MIMTPEQAKALLIMYIKRDAPHGRYNDNRKLAKLWRAIQSGEGQEDLVTSYKPRESDAQKKQRIEISHTPTPEAYHRITAPMARLDNPDGLIRDIVTPSENMQALMERINRFNGEKGMDQFVYETFKHANTTDPNSFLVVTLTGTRGPNGEWTEKPFPQPEIIPCEQVYNFGVSNGEYTYLIRLQRDTVISNGREVERKTYTMYYYDRVMVAVSGTTGVGEIVEVEMPDKTMQAFSIEDYYLGCKEVPFVPLGFVTDHHGGYDVVLKPVETGFRRLINRSSELELSIALHAFLQKFQFARQCRHQEQKHGICQNGVMSVSRSTCSKCNGTGKIIATSVQDVMLFDLPETKDEYFPLAEMVHWPTMPFEIVDFLKKEIPDILAAMEQTMWGVNIATPPSGDTVAVTATEIVGRYETVYKRLSDMGAHIERIWAKCLRLTAKYAELDKGLIYRYEYPASFQMETLPELLAMLKEAKSAGAPFDVISAIEVQILKKQGQVDNSAITWYKAATKFRPFKSKTSAEIAGIMATLPETSAYRVLHTYFDEIFEQIRESNPLFPQMSFEEQDKIIKAKVAEFVAMTAAETPAAEPIRNTLQ